MMERIKKLLDKQNVIGIHEDKHKVTVLVNKKLKMSTINKKIKDKTSPWTAKDIVPNSIRKWLFKKKKTEVIEVGNIKALANRKKYRPLVGGIEIGPENKRWVGTAGAVVSYMEWDNPGLLKPLKLIGEWAGMLPLLQKWGFKISNKPAIITNCHVTQEDISNPQATMMVQPGITRNKIGKTIYSTPIKKKARNYYDVSIIQVTYGRAEILQVGRPLSIREAKKWEKVKKYGRTTKYTEGQCQARNVTIDVDYGNKKFRKIRGVDLFTNMGGPGDSGSVIVAKKDNSAVSLLFAGSKKYTMGIPMPAVAKKASISF